MIATLQPALIAYFFPHRWVDPGNVEGTAQVKAAAEARIGPLLDQIEAQLARNLKQAGGPWLLGKNYAAADPLCLMLCRWTRHFARPARSLPHINAYLQRMLARPAVQRAVATEALTQPLV